MGPQVNIGDLIIQLGVGGIFALLVIETVLRHRNGQNSQISIKPQGFKEVVGCAVRDALSETVMHILERQTVILGEMAERLTILIERSQQHRQGDRL